jgi:hypothetical protein
VSGSFESTGNINGINLSTLSSSIASTFLNQNSATSSYEIKGRGIVSGSSQITYANISSIPSGIVSSSSQIDVMSTTNIARLATTGSNTFFGTQTLSGSLYIANDLIVQGSSSIQYISASSVSIGTNIVQLNTANPSVRFAGLTIIDSGSVGGSGSFLYDSVHDEFIFVHRGNGVNVTSSHFVLGPETYDSLGNETYLTNNRLPKGTGKEHLVDSNITDTGTLITLGSNTTITGTLVASGTSLVSSSAQVIGILSSLNTYTGSNDTTNTTQNSRLDQLSTASGSSITRLSALEVAESNLESFTSSINTTIKTRLNAETVISSSSQVNVMSTTNIARLATTGSNTFIGNQTINSTRTSGANVNGLILSDTVTGVQTAGFGVRIQYQSNGTGVNAAIGLENGGTGTNNESQISLYTQNTAGGLTKQLTVGSTGNITPGANGTQDLGSATARWSTVYTSDLSLNNGIGDWTIVEGEDDLFLYNNKKGKVYKFALTEVDPNLATPKKS